MTPPERPDEPEAERPIRLDTVPVDGGPVGPSTPQSASVNFLGATLSDTGAYPPDTMGAVGPAQYIVAVNGRIRTFNKSTGLADGVINADADVFFNSVMTPPAANNFTSDPRIRYDRLSGRWFIIIIDVPGRAGSLPNRVMIAVSDGRVITANTVWTFFQFQHDLVAPAGDTGEFADYPTLGVDANALYIGVNVFTATGTFDNTTGFVIRKSSILGAGPIVVTAFRGLIPPGNSGGAYTPHGVDNYDPAATEGYFIGVNSRVYGKLSLRRIASPGGTPSISGNVNITIPLNGPTINVSHLGNTGGTAGYLDGLDYRLLAAHIRNGRLWTSANLAVDNTGSPSGTDTRMGVRWYELNGIATGQTPGVVQSGTVYQPSSSNTTTNRSYWMGTVMVSGQGHAAMGFSVAGANEYVNAGTVGRLKNDTLGTMRTPVLYTASSTAYNAPYNRWGDYSYTSLDPNDDMTMWTIQEFCNAANSYGVQVVRLLAPPPATPSNCSPASITAGTTTNVVLTGLSNGDTGFFDPGGGFSNRIAAAVNGGGVTVNAVTYLNPTNLMLNISVSAGAATGARTVTTTNPDGQSTTSATGILTILAVGSTNAPPVLAAISNKTVVKLTTLIFTNTATDPDGQPLVFSLDPGAPTNASIHPSTGVFTWTPTEAQGPGTSNLTIRVTDNGSPPLSATQSFTVTVLETNSAPTLAAITNFTIYELTTLTFTNTASDPDLPANTLTFSFVSGAPPNATLNSSNGVFSWTPTEAQGPGTSNITVRVTDNGAPNLSATQSFTITVLETNSPPTLAAITNFTIYELTTLTFTNTASDPDLPANTLTFSFVSGAPSNATLGSSNGVFSWTPTEAQGPGTSNITVRVTDNGSPSLSVTQSFTITVLETNSAPTLAAITNFTIYELTTLTFTNTAGDPDLPANTLTFSFVSGAPSNATLGSSNGVFSWTPTEAQGPGTSNITVRVTDNGSPSLSVTQSFTVTVLETNSAPTLAGIADQNLNEGAMLSLTNSATDSDLPPNLLTYTLDPGAPTNATINPTNGVLTWTPNELQGPGTNNITVRVTDNGSPSMSATQTFTVVVNEVNQPPLLAAIPELTVYEGATLRFTNVVTDSDVPMNTFAFSFDLTPPAGANLDATTGVFSWTPTELQGGSTNLITVRVTDFNPAAVNAQHLSDVKSFTVLVLKSNLPPVLAPPASRALHAGSTLVVTNTATDPDLPANTLTFSLDSGAPAGAAINSTNGLLTWLTDSTDANTTNSITVRVTDDGVPALSDAKTFNVFVAPPPLIQTVSISNEVITITWTAIPGQKYRVQFNGDLSSTNWNDLSPDATAAGPTVSNDDSIDLIVRRFYRVRVLP